MNFRRGWIALFLFTLAMINYMDRVALSIAATPISKEFQMSPVAMGYLFSAFIWSYAILLLPMGVLIDRLGAKRMASWGVFIWSLATAFTGLANSIGALFVSRLVMGAGESTSNPIGAKVIRQWIPAKERGVMSSLFTGGSYAGPAFGAPLLAAVTALYGWRTAFISAGAVGLVWLVLWLIFFDLPEKVRWLKPEERSKILSEQRPAQETAVSPEAGKVGFGVLLRTRTLWGLAIAQGCNAYTQYLLLTWLPTYLQQSRHMSIMKTGAFAAIPYTTAVFCCILIGLLSDVYLKKTGVGSGRRRNAVALALTAGMGILAVPFTSGTTALLLVFCVTLTGNASASSMNYALLNDLLRDAGHIAKATAFIVLGGNVFGLIAPIATGYVVSLSGGYDWAFLIAGLLLLVGVIVTLTMTRQPIVTVGVSEPKSLQTPATAT
jgi:MFS family permease